MFARGLILACSIVACACSVEQPAVTEVLVAYSGPSGFIADWDINLRNGGTFIKMSAPLPVGTAVRLKMTAPEVVFPFDLEGRVSRVDLADAGFGSGMAVMFRQFEGEQRRRLASIVERLRREQALRGHGAR